MAGPLEGLLVVAIEQAVAGPTCTCRLADAGARVIKIERPEGDFARGYDSVVEGESAYFVWLNRGKESVVLDLKNPDDRDLVLAMLDEADVLVENLKPGSLERLGIEPAAIMAGNPRLIVASISGFAADGPNRDRKSYDLLIQAETGLASITGAPSEAGRVGVSICDISTGMNAYQAILEALLARAQTGKGCRIEVSLFDTMADWMTVPLLHHDYGGKAPGRVGLGHPSIAPYGVFQTGDGGELLIAVQNDREWRILATEVLGRADLADHPDFAANAARARDRAATDAVVNDALASMTRDQAIAALETAGIAWASYNGVDGLSTHEELHRMAVETPHGSANIPAPAARHDGQHRPPGRIPALGEHTDAVRLEFGKV
ncbi:MAG: CaiB/BaiF CoA-transferase family protein [Alphaproteobacteria bacterium]|nr:CaiB/BaiF CoA-transferase family protein [Alphaproteobacteria bacterium]